MGLFGSISSPFKWLFKVNFCCILQLRKKKKKGNTGDTQTSKVWNCSGQDTCLFRVSKRDIQIIFGSICEGCTQLHVCVPCQVLRCGGERCPGKGCGESSWYRALGEWGWGAKHLMLDTLPFLLRTFWEFCFGLALVLQHGWSGHQQVEERCRLVRVSGSLILIDPSRLLTFPPWSVLLQYFW